MWNYFLDSHIKNKFLNVKLLLTFNIKKSRISNVSQS